MADNFHAGILAGATSITIPIVFRDTASNLGKTGLTNAAMTASYWRPGSSRVAITVNSVASVQASFTSGGFIQIDSTNCPGLYRFDLPNQALAAGKDWVVIAVKASGVFTFYERFNLVTQTPKTVYDSMATVAAVESARADLATDVAALDFATQGEVESARADLATDIANLNDVTPSAVADQVWDELIAEHVIPGSYGNDVPSDIDLLPNAATIADSVWDELQGDHGGAGTMGGQMSDAVQAAGLTPASVSATVNNVIVAHNLDHLLKTSAPAGVPVSNTVMDKIMNKNASKTFDPSADSLEAIRDRGDVAWITGGGGAAPNTAAISDAVKANLVNFNLDHLLGASAPAGVPVSNTVMDKIMNKDGSKTFDPSADSLEAIRDRGDAAWITGGGGAAPNTAAISDAVNRALVDLDLHHLLNTSAPAGIPISNTILNKIMNADAGRTFDPLTDSLEAIRNQGDSQWTTGTFDGSTAVQGFVESARADLATDIATRATPANVESARAALNTDHNTLALRSYQESVRADLAADIAALDFATQAELESARADLATDIANLNNVTIASVSAAVATALSDYPVATSGAAAGGGVTVGSVGHAIWHYSLSAGMVVNQAGHTLRSAAANAGAVVSGAVSSADISNIWNRLRSANNVSGSFGQALNIYYGTGDVPVNHDTGGTNNLTLQDGTGSGIDEVRIRVYLKSDYDSGLITVPYLKGQSITDTAGKFKHPVYLDSGSTYTFVWTKPGSIETTTKEVTI